MVVEELWDVSVAGLWVVWVVESGADTVEAADRQVGYRQVEVGVVFEELVPIWIPRPLSRPQEGV